MADYGEKIQALMNEFYAGWQKEENKGKSKWDVLDTYSEAHQIAVVFGNFNYQVENGGLDQWIYNSYFHDDAEKLIGYLETGAKLDERCGTILDKIYKLDQCASDTECDRYGSFEDPDDDGESGFIGDMVDSDAFDTWYYAHCGNEDWWKTVSGVIDKTEGRDVALYHDAVQETYHGPEDIPTEHRVISLPTAQEKSMDAARGTADPAEKSSVMDRIAAARAEHAAAPEKPALEKIHMPRSPELIGDNPYI